MYVILGILMFGLGIAGEYYMHNNKEAGYFIDAGKRLLGIVCYFLMLSGLAIFAVGCFA